MDTFGAIAEAYVRIRAQKDSNFEKDARDSVLPGLTRLAGDVAGLAIGKKLFDIGKEGLDELKQAEQVTAQTAVQLKATGGAAGVTAEHIDKLGNEMLQLAGFDDEAARSAANVLLRFKEIQGTAAFDRVMKDAGDLAVTLGTDLPSAARTLGLALQDPEKAVRLLRSANVVLDQAQKDALKSAVAQGDQAKVQEIILGSLEKQVGGAAKAFGDTLAGSQARATESLKNAKAELIQGFAPAIQLGADITTKFAGVISAMPPQLQAAAGGVVFLGGELVALARPVGDILRLLEGLRAARAASIASAAAEAAATLAAAAATEAEAIALADLTAAEAAAATAAALAAVATKAEQLSMFEMTATGLTAIPMLEAEQLALFQVATGAAAATVATEAQALALAGLTTAEAGAAVTAGVVAGATEAMAAAEETAAIASGSLLIALGPIAIAAAAAAAAFAIFGSGTTEITADVQKFARASSTEIDNFVRGFARVPGIAAEIAHKLAEGGDAGVGSLVRLRDAAKAAGLDYGVYEQAIKDAAVSQSNLTGTQQAGTAALNSATGAVGDFNDATAGTPAVMDAAKAAIDAQKTAIGEMNTKLDETKAKFDAVAVAAHALLPASQRVQTGALDIADAQQHVIDAEQKLKDLRAGSPADLQKITDAQLAQAQAQKDYNDAVAKGDTLKAAEAQNRLAKATEAEVAARGKGADPEKVAQGERDVARSRLAVVTAVQNQATAIAELHVQQDAANGIVDSAVDKERFYHDALVGLDAQLTGPTHEAIAAHIADLDKVKTKTQEIIDKAQAVAKIDWTGMFRGMTGTARDLGLYAAAAREGQLGVASAPALGFDPAALNLSFVRTSELLADVKTKTNDLTAAFVANGATLDANTEAGRANQVAVQATGEAVAKLIVQKYQETGSLQEAQRAGNGYVENLRVQLRQAGLTETQVQGLIDTMHLTPKDIATRFNTNAIDTQTIVDTLRAHINDVPKDKQTAFQALIDQGSYDQANALLDQLAHDRQVRYDISKIGVDPGSFYVDANGNLQARAAGGYGTAGWVLRGEKGPELTYENMPSYTLPADVTAALSGGGSSGPTYNVNVTNYGSPPELAQSMVREVQRMGFLQTGTTKLARR